MRGLRGSTSLSFRLWLGTTSSAADDLYGSQHWYLAQNIPDPINASTQRAAKANRPSSLLGTTSACEK
jgi:hypothetical protein